MRPVKGCRRAEREALERIVPDNKGSMPLLIGEGSQGGRGVGTKKRTRPDAGPGKTAIRAARFIKVIGARAHQHVERPVFEHGEGGFIGAAYPSRGLRIFGVRVSAVYPRVAIVRAPHYACAEVHLRFGIMSGAAFT